MTLWLSIGLTLLKNRGKATTPSEIYVKGVFVHYFVLLFCFLLYIAVGSITGVLLYFFPIATFAEAVNCFLTIGNLCISKSLIVVLLVVAYFLIIQRNKMEKDLQYIMARNIP